MAFPPLKPGSGTCLGVYALGRYKALLIHKPESVGPISYIYMLIVTHGDSPDPVLVVTCERNEMQQELLEAAGIDADTARASGGSFLGCFTQDGAHSTLERWEQDEPDEDTFRQRAFRFTQSRLRIADAPRAMPLPPPPRKEAKEAFNATRASTPNEATSHVAWPAYRKLIAAAFVGLVLFPPVSETFFRPNGVKRTGHAGWKLILDVGKDSDPRFFVENINIELWLTEFLLLGIALIFFEVYRRPHK